MGATHVLAPVFVQVGLTLGILLWMGRLRINAVRSGVVRTSDIALGQSNWPAHIMQFSNAFRSQFELPVLFYLISVLSLFTARTSVILVVLAWIFVATRFLHALVYVTTNNVSRRFLMYVVGLAVLVLMWLIFGTDLYLGGAGDGLPLDIEALGNRLPRVAE